MANFIRNTQVKAMASIWTARQKARELAGRTKEALANREGQGTLDVAITVLISIVLGALILAGLYLIVDSTVLPTITQRIKDMFDYAGGCLVGAAGRHAPPYFLSRRFSMEFRAEIKRTLTGPDKLRAVCSVILDDCFLVKNVRVVEGEKGLFVSLPSRRNVKGEWTEQCFPMTKELREKLSAVVLAEYDRALAAEDGGGTPAA